jgi:hypothetical protein
MAVQDDPRQFIQSLGWPELGELWNSIRQRKADNWLPGQALEHLVLRMFQLNGADIAWPFSVDLHDEEVEQIDGAVYWNGLSCLCECKDQAAPVNFEPIAKLRNQLLRRPAGVVGMIFSSSGFTEAATILANFTSPQAVLLWGAGDIDAAIREREITAVLMKKHRYVIEQGVAFQSFGGTQ